MKHVKTKVAGGLRVIAPERHSEAGGPRLPACHGAQRKRLWHLRRGGAPKTAAQLPMKMILDKV